MKRAIFIGQAMPRAKKDPHDWPTLNAWLYSLEISDKQIREHFFYSALVDYFPGAKNGTHIVPTKEEIVNERPRLVNNITNFSPEIVVPIGKLSLSYCLNREVNLLEDFIGKSYLVNPYQALNKKLIVIPLPHPSGASTWRHKKENKKLLKLALAKLKQELYRK
ncbi:MAG: uracil-DNA glycosylase [Candidatus Woesebacteria bacterium GW2011_GWB1_38_5b]|uniref:Uracil-DNA glycosylase n=1 Tax=Candidatus Woesebacteria bacterium GW2011_GWB1_38_5b TaxID=1618569 RepID=A0A0G0MP97_9BACT|nr:MAG: uracil-DNA glycosylase [Candidatus Woesebacteria bacterium GW2011_GWB1_38_5b]